MRFSASMLKTWMSCPQQAKFKDVLRLPEAQHAKTTYGTCIHDALELYNNSGDAAAAEARFLETWANPEILDAVIDMWPQNTSYMELRERGVKAVRKFHEDNKWETRTIVANEHKFVVPFGEHTLSGIIDNLEITGSGKNRELRVIDYKTSSYTPSHLELRLDIQFTIYLYATHQEAFWHDVPNGEELYEKLKDTRRRGIWYSIWNHRTTDVGLRNELDMERLYRVLIEVERAIEHEVFVPNIKGDACMWCLGGETKVLTREQGWTRVDELAGGDHTILSTAPNGAAKWKTAPIRSYGEQELWEVDLQRGKQKHTIRATAEHDWLVQNGPRQSTERVQTHDLTLGSMLKRTPRHNQGLTPSRTGIQAGFVFGDGSLVRGGANGSHVDFHGEKDAEMLGWFEGHPTREYEAKPRFDRSIITNRSSYVRVPDLPAYFKATPPLDEHRNYLYGWLAGYFAADGSVTERGQCSIQSESQGAIRAVQDVCGILGIDAFGYSERIRTSPSEYVGKKVYRVTIRKSDLAPEFFLLSRHREAAMAVGNDTSFPRTRWRVTGVRPTGVVEQVYCAEVEDSHSFVIEGDILTGNCAYTNLCAATIPLAQEVEIARRERVG
jgi:RecB family exonuclease